MVATNLTLLIAVGLFVVVDYSKTSGSSPNVSLALGPEQDKINPLDKPSSAEVAVHVARLVQLDEATAVVNTADTAKAQLAVTSSDDQVIAKPQIIAPGLPSRQDIRYYTSVAGDTVSSIANHFGVTSDTIRNSNGLTGEDIPKGIKLVISPINGVVYKVKPGETLESIANSHRVSREQLVAFNDAEITGRFKAGELIIIPDAVQPITNATGGSVGNGFSYGSFSPSYGGNGYDYGFCTYYAAARSGAPNNWGNANTWHIYAQMSGWTVSSTPRVGAITQTSAGWAGHVGIVEDVSPDGRMIKYSDMNGLAGFNRVGYSDWVPAQSRFQRFIYH